MFKKARILGTAFVLPWMLAVTAGATHVSAATAQQAGPQTWTVTVGAAISTTPGEKPDWYALKFYPENLTIREGDTVVWKANAGTEPHNVVFLGNEQLPQSPIPPSPEVLWATVLDATIGGRR